MYRIDPEKLLRIAYRNKGLSLLLLDSFEEAIACFDKALSLDPNDYKAIIHKANACSLTGHYEEAITLYDKIIIALETKPDR